MQTLYIGFSTPNENKFLPWAIRKTEHTKYSHVYIRRESKTIGNYVYQASGLSVNFMGEAIFKSHNIIIREFKIQVSDEIFNKLIRFMVANSGKPYSIKQLFTQALVKLKSFLRIKSKKCKEVNGSSEFICSELAGVIMRDYLGIEVQKNQDALTPKDIYELLESANL